MDTSQFEVARGVFEFGKNRTKTFTKTPNGAFVLADNESGEDIYLSEETVQQLHSIIENVIFIEPDPQRGPTTAEINFQDARGLLLGIAVQYALTGEIPQELRTRLADFYVENAAEFRIVEKLENN